MRLVLGNAREAFDPSRMSSADTCLAAKFGRKSRGSHRPVHETDGRPTEASQIGGIPHLQIFNASSASGMRC